MLRPDRSAKTYRRRRPQRHCAGHQAPAAKMNLLSLCCRKVSRSVRRVTDWRTADVRSSARLAALDQTGEPVANSLPRGRKPCQDGPAAPDTKADKTTVKLTKPLFYKLYLPLLAAGLLVVG